MRRLATPLPAVLLVLLLVPPAAGQYDSREAPSKPRLRTDLLVSTQWLAEHVNDPKLVILHLGGRPADYEAGHIPGARFLPMDKIADQKPPGTELLPPEQLQKAFEEVGVSDDSRIVLYSPAWDPMATRAFFTLDYIGHGEHAALLDGGMEKWVLENRPLSTGPAKAVPGSLTIKLRPEIVLGFDTVRSLDSPNKVVLVDSRPLKRYRMGHISGAAPLFWEKALVSAENPVLRSPQELTELFAASGAAPGKKVVSYCEVGLQASHTYFVARYLGFDAALYDGSFSEWNDMQHAPSVRGDSRR